VERVEGNDLEGKELLKIDLGDIDLEELVNSI